MTLTALVLLLHDWLAINPSFHTAWVNNGPSGRREGGIIRPADSCFSATAPRRTQPFENEGSRDSRMPVPDSNSPSGRGEGGIDSAPCASPLRGTVADAPASCANTLCWLVEPKGSHQSLHSPDKAKGPVNGAFCFIGGEG